MDFTLGYKGEEINELLGKASTALQGNDISHLATQESVSELSKRIDEMSGADSEASIPLSRDFSDDFNNDYAR